jgi:hypothetical protein
MTRMFSPDSRRVLHGAVGVVWLLFTMLSFVLSFPLIPIPVLSGVFAAIFLWRAPSRDAAHIGTAAALLIALVAAALIPLLPGQDSAFAELAVLALCVALYTYAAAALAGSSRNIRER